MLRTAIARVARAGVRSAPRAMLMRSAPSTQRNLLTLTRSTPLRSMRSTLNPSQAMSWHCAQALSFSSSAAASSSEDTSTEKKQHEFKAETRQLLDIVTHSIYTDKEVFVRELISNASDALEKLRHVQATGQTIADATLEPKITMHADEKARTLTIADTGMGMTEQELVDNLGTIARSGSKAFIDQLKESGSTTEGDALSGIIGKFGVGFYSAFMVADSVEVFSQSAKPNEPSHVWRSDGSGSFEIAPASDVTRGCKIVLHLKEDCKDYATPSRIESIIRQYSNFVSFPIELNGATVNTVQALWTKNESDVTEDEYKEFYKFIANAFDEPLYRISFKADAPLELKTLFFIGSSHTEKFGYARLTPGVSLYSRKVLIERNSADILPDWMRFVRGVVDSEDLPLSLSREKMQDSRLLGKLKDVLTKRIIRFLDQQSTKEPEKFDKFFTEFGQFIKEGICTDFANKNALAKLLRYESSQLDADKVTTLDEYVSRCPPEQKEVYYLCAPNRTIAEASPYFEAFKKLNKEVLFVYHPIDDFVMTNIAEFNGRKVISVENAKIDVDESADATDSSKLTEDQQRLLGAWLKLTLEKDVKEIKFTSRLTDSPAVISEHESAAMRRMMSMVNASMGHDLQGAIRNVLEINPRHPMIVDLNTLRDVNKPLAEKVAKQIFLNAKVAAGLVEDGRSLLPDLNSVLGDLVAQSVKATPTESS